MEIQKKRPVRRLRPQVISLTSRVWLKIHVFLEISVFFFTVMKARWIACVCSWCQVVRPDLLFRSLAPGNWNWGWELERGWVKPCLVSGVGLGKLCSKIWSLCCLSVTLKIMSFCRKLCRCRRIMLNRHWRNFGPFPAAAQRNYLQRWSTTRGPPCQQHSDFFILILIYFLILKNVARQCNTRTLWSNQASKPVTKRWNELNTKRRQLETNSGKFFIEINER